jgi:hypothetical protein
MNEEDAIFGFIHLIDAKIYRESICKNLEIEEANQLRKALNRKILECIYPVPDKDKLILQIPWVSSKMVRLFRLISRKGTHYLLKRVLNEANGDQFH